MTLSTPGQCMYAPHASSLVPSSPWVQRPGPMVSTALRSSDRKFSCSYHHLQSCDALTIGCHECAPTLCGRYHRDTSSRCHPCSQKERKEKPAMLTEVQIHVPYVLIAYMDSPPSSCPGCEVRHCSGKQPTGAGEMARG